MAHTASAPPSAAAARSVLDVGYVRCQLGEDRQLTALAHGCDGPLASARVGAKVHSAGTLGHEILSSIAAIPRMPQTRAISAYSSIVARQC